MIIPSPIRGDDPGLNSSSPKVPSLDQTREDTGLSLPHANIPCCQRSGMRRKEIAQVSSRNTISDTLTDKIVAIHGRQVGEKKFNGLLVPAQLWPFPLRVDMKYGVTHVNPRSR